MTTALPVLLNLMPDEVVDCEPYRLKAIRKRICVERYLLASGFGGKRESGGTEKSEVAAQLKQGHCRHCPIGERRAAELGQVKARGPVKSLRKAPSKPVIRTANVGFELSIDRESAAHPQAGVVAPARNEDEEGPMKCPECKTTFEPRKSDQKFCGRACRIEYYKSNPPPSRGGKAPSRRAKGAKATRSSWKPTPVRQLGLGDSHGDDDSGDVSTPAKASPFLIWVQLQDRIDERKRIAAESIAAAELDLARFEEQHPDVLYTAVERYERAKSKASSTPAPHESALPPPETEFAEHLASADSEE